MCLDEISIILLVIVIKIEWLVKKKGDYSVSSKLSHWTQGQNTASSRATEMEISVSQESLPNFNLCLSLWNCFTIPSAPPLPSSLSLFLCLPRYPLLFLFSGPCDRKHGFQQHPRLRFSNSVSNCSLFFTV